MGGIPKHQQSLDNTTNLIDVFHTFILTVPGWAVDSYTAGSALFIHNTSTDGTVGYYSMGSTSGSANTGYLNVYCNTGYSGGSVDSQPGVLSNATNVATYIVEFGTSYGGRIAHMMANEDYFFITSTVSGLPEYSYSFVYMGIIEKAFAFTGGNIAMGNKVVGSTPTMVYYDDSATAEWYTVDGGAFADANGVAAELNVINYDSSAIPFDFGSRILRINPYEVFIEHDGGFAPLGHIRNLWFAYNEEMYFFFPPYSYMPMADATYFVTPIGSIVTDSVITVVPGA